jgi:hypothetical protein
MIATLAFNLPEDQNDFIMATRGHEFYSVLVDLDNTMRARLKYGTGPETIEELRKDLHEALRDRNLSLDMIQ